MSTAKTIDDAYMASLEIRPDEHNLDFNNGNQNVTITNEGLQHLADNRSVVFSKTLKRIDLSRNQGITSLTPLIENLLSRNDTITEIKVDGCTNLDGEEVKVLHTILGFNQHPPLLKMHLYRMYQQNRKNPLSEEENAKAGKTEERELVVVPGEEPTTSAAEASAATEEPAAAPEEGTVATTTTTEIAAPFISPMPPPLPPQQQEKTIVSIDLDEKRSYHPYDDAAVASLVETVLLAFPLQHHQFRIRSLSLRNNAGVTVESAKLLSRWLTVSQELEVLDFSSSSIGSDGIWHLSEGLKENHTLKTLMVASVGGCDLVAATALATTLERNNKTLQCLDMRQNGMSAEAVNPLVLMFRSHSSLVTLDIIEGNEVDINDSRLIHNRLQTLREPRVLSETIPMLIQQDERIAKEKADRDAAALANAQATGQRAGEGDTEARPHTPIADPSATALEAAPLIVSLDFAFDPKRGDAPLNDTSLTVLIAALQNNATVRSIDISGNSISCDGFRDLCQWMGNRRCGETNEFRCANLQLDKNAVDLRPQLISAQEYAAEGTTTKPFATLVELIASRPAYNAEDPSQLSRPVAETLRVLDYSNNFVEPGVREFDVYNLIHQCSTDLQHFGVEDINTILSSVPYNSTTPLHGHDLQTKVDIWITAKNTTRPLVQALVETLLLMPRTADAMDATELEERAAAAAAAANPDGEVENSTANTTEGDAEPQGPPSPIMTDDLRRSLGDAETLILDGPQFDDGAIVLFSRCLKHIATETQGQANPLPFTGIRCQNTIFTNTGCDIFASALLNYSDMSMPHLSSLVFDGIESFNDDGMGYFTAIPQNKLSFKHMSVTNCPYISPAVPLMNMAEAAAATQDGSAAVTEEASKSLSVVPITSVLTTRPPVRVINDLLEFNQGTPTFRKCVEAVLTAAHYSDDHPAASAAPADGTSPTQPEDGTLDISNLPSYLATHPITPVLVRRFQVQQYHESLAGVTAASAATSGGASPTRRPPSAASIVSNNLSALGIPQELGVNMSQDTSEHTGFVDDYVVRNAIIKYWLGAPRAFPANTVHYALLDTLRINNNMVREQGLVDILSLLCGVATPSEIDEGTGINSAGVKVVFHLRVLDVSNNLITESISSPLRELLPLLVKGTGRNVDGNVPVSDSTTTEAVSPRRQRIATGNRSATALPFLETVNLSYNDISDETVSAMAAAMHSQRCYAPSLTNLVVNELPRVHEDTHLFVRRSNSLNTRHALKHLMHQTADYMRVGKSEGDEGATTEWVSFDCGRQTNDDQFNAVCEHLTECIEANQGRVCFSEFKCSQGQITSAALPSFLPLLPLIKKLDLSGNQLDGEALTHLGQSLNELSAEEQAATASGAQPSVFLDEMDLSYNRLIRGTDAADTLRKALMQNRSLTTLKLEGTSLTPTDRDDLTHHVRLNTQPTLQALYPKLAGCDINITEIILCEPIDEVTIVTVERAVKASPFLKSIDFGGAGRTQAQQENVGGLAHKKFDDAWQSFCETLRENTTVESLKLTGIGLTNTHVSTLLLTSFKDSPTRIAILDLSGNDLVNAAGPISHVSEGIDANADATAAAVLSSQPLLDEHFPPVAIAPATPTNGDQTHQHFPTAADSQYCYSPLEATMMKSPVVYQSQSPAGATLTDIQNHHRGISHSVAKTPSGTSPLPVMESPDVVMDRPEESAQHDNSPLQITSGPSKLSILTLSQLFVRILNFHSETLRSVVLDDKSEKINNAERKAELSNANEAVFLAAKRNNGHSPTVKRDLIALARANEELSKLKKVLNGDNVPNRDQVVPVGRANPRSITMEVAWNAQDLNDEGLEMLLEQLSQLLELCSVKVYYTDNTDSHLSSLEITDIDLRGNPALSCASTIKLATLVSYLMSYTHRLPSEMPLRYSMVRLDNSGSENSDELATNLTRTLNECPYLLLSCEGCKMLSNFEKELTFFSRCNEEPMRFREMLLHFKDSPPTSAIFSYFPTEIENEVASKNAAQFSSSPARPSAPAVDEYHTPHRPRPEPPAGPNPRTPTGRTPGRYGGGNAHAAPGSTPMSTRRQQQHVEYQAATGAMYPSATDHHLRKVRGVKLTDHSMDLLANRLTQTVSGRKIKLRKIILPNNAITSKGFGQLLRCFMMKPSTLAPTTGLGDDGTGTVASSSIEEDPTNDRHNISQIDFSNNAIDDDSLDDLLAFMEAKAAHLEHIDLSGNRLTSMVVGPMLAKIHGNDTMRAMLRTAALHNTSSLMPVSASDRLRLGVQLHVKGSDVEVLGWNILRNANNPEIFCQFGLTNRFYEAASEEEREDCVGKFDMTHRAHNPNCVPLLLTLCQHSMFTRGITVLNLSRSGISSFERSGFRLSQTPAGAAANLAGKQMLNDDDDEPEYFSLCDVLVDFICSSESLEVVNLSYNKLSMRSVVVPILLDAVRLNRTIKHVDVSYNADPELDGTSGDVMSALEAAQIIDEDVLVKNKFLERVIVGPATAEEKASVPEFTSSLKDSRVTIVVEE